MKKQTPDEAVVGVKSSTKRGRKAKVAQVSSSSDAVEIPMKTDMGPVAASVPKRGRAAKKKGDDDVVDRDVTDDQDEKTPVANAAKRGRNKAKADTTTEVLLENKSKRKPTAATPSVEEKTSEFEKEIATDNAVVALVSSITMQVASSLPSSDGRRTSTSSSSKPSKKTFAEDDDDNVSDNDDEDNTHSDMNKIGSSKSHSMEVEEEDDDEEEDDAPPEEVAKTEAPAQPYPERAAKRARRNAKPLPDLLPEDVLQRAAVAFEKAESRHSASSAAAGPKEGHIVFSDDDENEDDEEKVKRGPSLNVVVLGKDNMATKMEPTAATEFAKTAFNRVKRVSLAKMHSSTLKNKPSLQFKRR